MASSLGRTIYHNMAQPNTTVSQSHCKASPVRFCFCFVLFFLLFFFVLFLVFCCCCCCFVLYLTSHIICSFPVSLQLDIVTTRLYVREHDGHRTGRWTPILVNLNTSGGYLRLWSVVRGQGWTRLTIQPPPHWYYYQSVNVCCWSLSEQFSAVRINYCLLR
jgi:hypothetical protein